MVYRQGIDPVEIVKAAALSRSMVGMKIPSEFIEYTALPVASEEVIDVIGVRVEIPVRADGEVVSGIGIVSSIVHEGGEAGLGN